MPALSNAKLRAQASTCISNQKQLGLAWTMYADDNGGRIINMDTSTNTIPSLPWRFDTPKPPPPIPQGTSGPDKDKIILQAGYQAGGLYRYAPNVNVLPLPVRSTVAQPFHRQPNDTTRIVCLRELLWVRRHEWISLRARRSHPQADEHSASDPEIPLD